MKKLEVSLPVAAMIVFSGAYIAATVTALISLSEFNEVMSSFLLVVLSVVVYITVIFLLAQYVVKRLDIVDIAWGGGFIVAAISSFILGKQTVGFNIATIASLLVIVWGARLGYYILKRVTSHPEDKRYVELRKTWKGNIALNAYLRIFVTQGLLASVIAIAVIHINLSVTTAPNLFVFLGVAIWLIGFFFESVGDMQLKAFLANSKNKGKLMTRGLWQYTRHPNYFGESTQWWGMFVIALGTMYGVVGIVTPVVITFLLLFVSGVPMTEKNFAGKPGWDKYKKRTSKFFPLPPKS